jgi:predicted SAM-dependent methyltransferase
LPTKQLEHIADKLRNAVTVYVGTRLLLLIARARRDGQIDRYFAEYRGERYLRIGAGRHADRGWLATDLVPLRRAIVYMDGTKPFPLPDESFDGIVCEHMIEHVPYESGLRVLRECHRVLKLGGVLRIATPDLDFVRHLTDLAPYDENVAAYVRASNCKWDTHLDGEATSNPVFVINRMMRAWGHTFLYDRATLSDALRRAGFENIVTVDSGSSEHPAFVGVDRHGEEIGELYNKMESLVLEATARSRPGQGIESPIRACAPDPTT